MKLLLIALLLLPFSVHAQEARPTAGRLMGGAAVPTGSCNSAATRTDIYIRSGVSAANSIYLCNSGGWVLFSGGSGGSWGDIIGVLSDQADLQSALDSKAPKASPTFTGTVVIPAPFTLGAVSVLPTGTELNFVDGVTSAIQTQLDAKSALASPAFTGVVTIPTPFTLGAVSVLPTGTELNFVDGVTSAIQTQLDAKQSTLTNSAGLAAALSDETGTSLAVFSNTPTLTTPNIGAATGTSLVASGSVTAASFATSATSAGQVTLSEPTGTGSDGVTLSAPASVTTSYTMKFPAAIGTGFFRIDGTDAITFVAETGSGNVARPAGSLVIASGKTATTNNTLTFAGTDGTTQTFQATDTIVGRATTDTLTNKTLTAPKLADLGFIADANGNELIIGDTVTSAVNELTIANAAASGEPSIAATGSDTDVSILLVPKGAGTVDIGTSADAAISRIAANVIGIPWIQTTSGRCFLAADQTNATTTMANVTGCSVSVTSGRKYTFKAILYLTDSTAVDGAKIDFDGGSATMTNFRCHCTAFDTALNLSSQSTALATDFAASTFTGAGMFECHGTMEPSSSSTFIPRMAQNAHTTGTLTLARGSFLTVEDMP